MSIRFKSKGNFSATTKLLNDYKNHDYASILERYGLEGVRILAEATPKESGQTANSWRYRVSKKRGRYKLSFFNDNVQNGVPIAIILQYGHATRNGGWVEGRDYINSSIQPIFDKIAEQAWKEVTGR